MSNTQPLAETPPSTEVMCHLMAEWKDWKQAWYYPTIDMFVSADPSLRTSMKAAHDPRTDAIAAMQLLNYLANINGWAFDSHQIGNIGISDWTSGELVINIPIHKLCTATCNLAAKCLGLSEGGA